MIVEIKGHGKIDFPDSMSDDEIKDVLKQFDPKKDNSLVEILQTINKTLSKQKPVIVQDTKIEIKEIPVPVVETKLETVMIEKEICKPVSWKFTIERDEYGISEIIAEPINGK